MKRAVYPLSADPIHYGHVANLIATVESGLFDEIYLAIGNNVSKKYLLSAEERVFLARQTIAAAGLPLDKIIVESFTGLLRNYAALRGIDVAIRGYRNGFDSDYEAMLADFNGRYGLRTCVIPAHEKWRNISSTILRSIVSESGLIHDFVHPATKQLLEKKLRGLILIGVTGNAGAGKTTVCSQLAAAGDRVLPISHVNFDALVKAIYQGTMPLHKKVQKQVREALGDELFENNVFSAHRCAHIIFHDPEKRRQLADILCHPVVIELEETLKNKTGIVLVEAAYFAEYNLLPFVNYNILLVECDEHEQRRRLMHNRNRTPEEAAACLSAQFDQKTRKERIMELQKNVRHGFLHVVDATRDVNVPEVIARLQDYCA